MLRPNEPKVRLHDVWTSWASLGSSSTANRVAWRCERHQLEAQKSTLRAARVVDVYHSSGIRGQPASRIMRDGPVAVLQLNERRAIVVLTSAASDEIVSRVAQRLDATRIPGLDYTAAVDS